MKRVAISFSVIISCEILIAVIISVMTTIHLYNIVSLLFSISFVLLFIYLMQIYNRFPVLPLFLSVICLLNVIINAFLNNGNLSFEYLKKLIMFITFVLMLTQSCTEGPDVSERAFKILKFFPILGAIELISSFFFLGNTSTLAHAITLGFSNPNFAGMWLLHFILYAVLLFMNYKEHKLLVLMAPVIILLGWLLYLTGARSCFLALAVFFLMLILKKLNIVVPPWACTIIAVFPFVFAFIYVRIIENPWVNNTFGFLVSVGKGLNSRVGIWNNAIDVFLNHPLFGDYYGISHGTGQSQLHNTHLDVMCSYGLVPIILYVVIIKKTLQRILAQAVSFNQYGAFSAFCTVLIVGCFEAAMVSGAMGMNLLTIGYVVLAYENLKQKDGKIYHDNRRYGSLSSNVE